MTFFTRAGRGPKSRRYCARVSVRGLSLLGTELNESRNAETAGLISTDGSRATVRVIRTDED